MRLQRLNGQIFEAMVRGGFTNLCNHEKEINEMNIFPVPDGDTGFNMRRTLENGIEHAKSDKHFGRYIKQLSHGMLLGARGNSGVILSQLFRGIAEELADDGIVDAGEMRNALIRAYKTAYSAVIHPVEGTLLTVAREGIENILPQIRHGITCDLVLSLYLAEMKKSVKHTPEILDVLREANVLDSGAVGYITIFDGMVRTMYGEEILPKKGTDIASETVSAQPNIPTNATFEYGYCMEFLLQLTDKERQAIDFEIQPFIGTLTGMGTSLVALESDGIVKVHIHTFCPEKVMEFARRYGEFVTFKLENMQMQHNEFIANQAKKKERVHKKLAVVAVADGDGISDILTGCGCDIVLRGGQSMNPPSEDFVNAFESFDADRIVVLPNNRNIIQTARQAGEVCGLSNVTVLETKSVMEGYYALALGSPDIEDTDERIGAMRDGAESITTVYVAKAIKDYQNFTFSCKCGDYIGFIGSKLISASQNIETALVEAVKAIPDIAEKGSFVLLRGSNLTADAEEKIDKALDTEFSDMDREFLDGGQQIYDVIVGIV